MQYACSKQPQASDIMYDKDIFSPAAIGGSAFLLSDPLLAQLYAATGVAPGNSKTRETNNKKKQF